MCFRNSVGFLFVNRKIEKAGHKTQSVNVTEILDFHQKIDSAVVTAVTAETVAFPKLVGIRETVNSRAPGTFQVLGFEDHSSAPADRRILCSALSTRKNGIHRALADTKLWVVSSIGCFLLKKIRRPALSPNFGEHGGSPKKERYLKGGKSFWTSSEQVGITCLALVHGLMKQPHIQRATIRRFLSFHMGVYH